MDRDVMSSVAGSGDYVVKIGDSLISIAFERGLLPDTIWQAPENEALREARPDAEVLLPGDRMTIPQKRIAYVSKPDSQRHVFRRKAVPHVLRVTLLDVDDEPLADKPVKIDIDGRKGTGVTNSAGQFRHPIQPNARNARIVVDEVYTFEIRLGYLSPVQTLRGVQERLRNLGFYEGSIDAQLSPQLTLSLTLFQSSRHLQPTGLIDQATEDELDKLTTC
jgi:hypothetical protein